VDGMADSGVGFDCRAVAGDSRMVESFGSVRFGARAVVLGVA
jgi:hypothetical protein